MCALLSLVYGLCKPCWLTHVTCTCFKETALLLNVHLSCFMDFVLCPTDKCMFKVTNKKIRLICWMCSKLKINAAWHSSGDHSLRISIVFLLLTLLTLNKYLAVGRERQVIMFWKYKKLCICFLLKSPTSLSNLSLHRIEINYKHMTILWTCNEHITILWTYVSTLTLL